MIEYKFTPDSCEERLKMEQSYIDMILYCVDMINSQGKILDFISINGVVINEGARVETKLTDTSIWLEVYDMNYSTLAAIELIPCKTKFTCIGEGNAFEIKTA